MTKSTKMTRSGHDRRRSICGASRAIDAEPKGWTVGPHLSARWSACKANVVVATASMWRNALPLLVTNLM